jgi:Lrp/AsnC family transcriptional regulator for asnA, asnC and gidA
MPTAIDGVDRRIIALLAGDGRASAAHVSRALDGVSERSVRSRIARLVRAGVVHIGAVVDPQALGYHAIADVYVEVAPGEAAEVARRLARCENVLYVAASIGNGDLSIQVCARDDDDLERVVAKVVRCIPGVRRTRVARVPWRLKRTATWAIPADAQT